MTPYYDDGQARALVAKSLGRKAIGIDLNTEYLEMAIRRCAQLGLFVEAAS